MICFNAYPRLINGQLNNKISFEIILPSSDKREDSNIDIFVAEAYTTQPNSKASSRVLYMYFS